MEAKQLIEETTKRVPAEKAIGLLNRVVKFFQTTTSQKLSISIRDAVEPIWKKLVQRMNAKLDTYTEQHLAAPPIIFAPSNTKLIRKGFATTILIIEQKPTVKTLSFDFTYPAEGDSRQMRVSLSLPYVWFAFVKNDVNGAISPYLFVGKKSLASESDQLCAAPFTNINHEGRICFGREMTGWETRGSNLAETIDNFIVQFWQTKFVDEWTDNWVKYKNTVPELKNLTQWSKSTQEDPAFGIKIPLIGVRTLSSFVTEMLQARGTPQDLESVRIDMERFVRSETESLGFETANLAVQATLPGFHPVNTVEQLRTFLTDFIKEAKIIANEEELKRIQEESKMLRVEASKSNLERDQYKAESERMVREISKLIMEIDRLKNISSRKTNQDNVPDGLLECVLMDLAKIYDQSEDVRTKELIRTLHGLVSKAKSEIYRFGRDYSQDDDYGSPYNQRDYFSYINKYIRSY